MNTVDIILASVEFANMFKIKRLKDFWRVHTCQEGNSRTCPGSIISIVAISTWRMDGGDSGGGGVQGTKPRVQGLH
jgi:hypothetical protein